MLAWFPSAQPTVIPFYVSRHQQKIPWLVSSSIIWPLITTTDQSETIPFVRSGYFSECAKWVKPTVLRIRRVWRDFGRRFPTEGGRLSALPRGSNNRRTPTPGGCDTARVLRPRYRP